MSCCGNNGTPIGLLGSFVKAQWQFAKGGFATVTASQLSERLSACRSDCPNYDHSTDCCTLCGCYLESDPLGGPGKAKRVSENCPSGRWPLLITTT